MKITWTNSVPEATEYLELRRACDMMPREAEAAAAGLAGGLYTVTARGAPAHEEPGARDDTAPRNNADAAASDEPRPLIGLGRVVGDGGCFFQVVDIMVHPDHQRRGIGTEIMRRIMEYISHNADASAHVNLFANPNAVELYERFGFARTDSVYIGMDLPRDAAGRRSTAARTLRPSAGMQAFQTLDLRVGTVVTAEEFPEARKPAYKLRGRQVVCAVNLGERRIGPFTSECLVLGIQDDAEAVVLIGPDRPVPDGRRVY
jgi:GNAT superfamily N-acetyltransferase